MTENEVNIAVASFLKGKKANILRIAVDREQGFDVHAEILGYSLIVESKGSMKNNQNDTVFDSGQLKTHAGAQVLYLMKQFEYSSEKTILIMANPNIPRIRKVIDDISLAINNLKFIRFWVNPGNKVEVEYPDELAGVIKKLGLV
ncbi:CRISPR/Cas system-associated exonuclease Cas4 (RecB family) [Paenibacillus jamilae]|nr:CRISPR/Cas system-associated exonuclease Cas4 (RecB family) [Paenibacillus jamilae]